MTIYITQGRYTREAIVGMIDTPEDRTKAVTALADGVGAKVLGYYVTFGKYDFLVVFESDKSETNFMAAVMTAAATGGVTDLKTTVGVRPREAIKAMKVAKKITKSFKPAGHRA